MKKHRLLYPLVALAAFAIPFGAIAAPKLWPWDDAHCFRNSINFCAEGEVWVRDQWRPSRCGCLKPTDFLSLEMCQSTAITCDPNAGETFARLYNAMTRVEIGCGCFE